MFVPPMGAARYCATPAGTFRRSVGASVIVFPRSAHSRITCTNRTRPALVS